MSYRQPRNVRRELYDVEDLRQKLNKIKLEKEKKGIPAAGSEAKNRPPPDPLYNFLKDPLRDGSTKPRYELKRNEHPVNSQAKNFKTDDNKASNVVTEASDKKPDLPIFVPKQPWKPHNFRSNFQNKQYLERASNKTAVFQKPIKVESVQNIKVEFSNESGERKCTFDENVNVDVPVMPKKKFYFTQKPGKFFAQRPYKHYSPRPKFEQHKFFKDKAPNQTDDKEVETTVRGEKSDATEDWDNGTTTENKGISPSTENKTNANEQIKTMINDNSHPEN